MKEITLLYCKHCKKVVELLPGTHCCDTICCGEPMTKLVPNTTEASVEKHIPVLELKGNVAKVSVGSTLHPMSSEHYIMFVYLITNKNVYRHDFTPTDSPVCEFALLEGEKVEQVLSYCNLHSLWAAKL